MLLSVFSLGFDCLTCQVVINHCPVAHELMGRQLCNNWYLCGILWVVKTLFHLSLIEY